MRKFTLFITLLVALATTAVAQGTLNETVVFDFANYSWGIPTMEENNYSSIKTAGEYEIDKLKSRRDKFFDAILNDMKK